MNNNIIVSVIPNWEIDSPYYHFDVYSEGFFNDTVSCSKLFDIIQELSHIANEYNIEVDVFANYNGNKDLIEFYNELMSIFNKGNFHMEYEWG